MPSCLFWTTQFSIAPAPADAVTAWDLRECVGHRHQGKALTLVATDQGLGAHGQMCPGVGEADEETREARLDH